jgi:hypothetical protein
MGGVSEKVCAVWRLKLRLLQEFNWRFRRFWNTSNPLQDSPQPIDLCFHLRPKWIKFHNFHVSFQNRQGLTLRANASFTALSFSTIVSTATMRKLRSSP